MTTVLGAASPCRRAARLGVSPSANCSCRVPPPISPTTTSPVWIPRRTASCTPAPAPGGYSDAPWPPRFPGQPARPVGHHLRVPGDSRSRPGDHRRDTGRYGPHSGRSPWRRSLDRPAPPRASSSGSSWLARTVESTRSLNSTVSWRRSASGDAEFGESGVWRERSRGLAGVVPRLYRPRQPRPAPGPPHRAPRLGVDEFVLHRGESFVVKLEPEA